MPFAELDPWSRKLVWDDPRGDAIWISRRGGSLDDAIEERVGLEDEERLFPVLEATSKQGGPEAIRLRKRWPLSQCRQVDPHHEHGRI